MKIDRSFINEITTKEGSALLVKAIVAMTISLGKELVAEGVETEAQISLLRSIGCEQVQGFFYSKALSPEALHSFVSERLNQ